MHIKLLRLIVLLLVGCPTQTCMPQQPSPKPIKVYLLAVDSDLKGDFAQLGPELTAALEIAFSSEPSAFTLLDRTNLDELVKANQLESDLDAVLHGKAPSPKLAQVTNANLAHADGFIRCELKEGADGAVLSVALVMLDSTVPWSKQLNFTVAKWLSNDTQRSAAGYLAEDAAHKLLPPKVVPNTSVPSNDLGGQRTEPAAKHEPSREEIGTTESTIEPIFDNGASLSPDAATAIAQSAQRTAAKIVSDLADLGAKSTLYYNGEHVSSVRDELQKNGIEFAALNDAIHTFETKPTAESVEHCAETLRAVAKALLEMARRTSSSPYAPTTLPSPQVEQSPGQFMTESYRMSAGTGQRWQERGKRVGTGTSEDPYNYEMHDMLNLPITVETLLTSHFHFAIHPNSCYLADEKGNTWTQDAPDSNGSYYNDSVGISSQGRGIEMQPNVPLRSTFFFVAEGETSGTIFTLVCSEESPTKGRQIIIRSIKSH